MNKANRAVAEESEERVPQLRVVVSKNGATRRYKPSVPLVMPLSLYKRVPRRELTVLGWTPRALRLGVKC
jgi:hypothetical protein